MSRLDDIDEDEPVAVVINTNKPANPSVLDDLFGPSSAPARPAAASSSGTTQSPAAPASVGSPLDDFFGSKVAKTSGGGGAQASQKADVFDSLFSSSATPASAGVGGRSSFVDSQQQPQQKARSALDQLDAFSAVMSGGAAPWMQTKSVHDSRTVDFDAGSAAGRVFIPPDSVLGLMTLYDVLGAAPNWTLDDIGKAYKKKALALHPDKLQGGRTEAEERYFKLITAAYDIMKDEQKRAEYDAALRGGKASSSGTWLNFVA
jgi:DnaJ-class molecular chaperone